MAKGLAFAKWVFPTVIVLSLGVWFFLQHNQRTVPTLPEILSNESVAMLVTNKVTTQVVIFAEEDSVLLGVDSTIGIGIVTALVGIDTKKIEYLGDNEIRLPQPEIFSLELREDSVEFFRDATIFQRISNLNEDQSTKVRKLLRERAKGFIQDSGLMPSQDNIEGRMRTIIRDLGGPREISFVS